MKKLLSFVLSVVMTLSLAIPAFAAESTNMTQEDIRNEIIEIIANADTVEERDAQLCAFLEKNPLEPIQMARSSTGEAVLELVEAVDVDENTQVDFYSTGDFGIRELEDLGITATNARAVSYTNTYRASYTIKNIFGGKIVETYVKGYFKYDGSSIPTPYLEDAGYSKGTLIFWDCSSWDDGTGRNYRDNSAYCYADAYYDWTIDVSLGGSAGGELGGGVEGEISGSVSDGLTIQDCNVYLKLICSKTGAISASVSVED